ncbi:MAG: ORF6N domain-containing protein [bacterium]
MSDELVPIEVIENKIYFIRGQKVMLDKDLAVLYGVKTFVLNQSIKRNLTRFPEDFMFRLTVEEFNDLRSQIVISSWGGRRYFPYAFTEQGIAMLSSVLHSERAIQVDWTKDLLQLLRNLMKNAC